MKKWLTCLGVVILVLALSFPAPARVRSAFSIVTITVNSAADTEICITNSICTLRGAIEAANNSANATNFVTINIDFYGTIVLGSPLPAITNTPSYIKIIGSTEGTGTRISGANLYQIFTVNQNASLALNDLYISYAYSNLAGAALRNLGTTYITHCTFSHNTSTLDGGAIYNTGWGTLDTWDSTFSYNSADAGGAIYAIGMIAQISTTTFDHNTATTDGGAIAGLGSPTGTQTIIWNSTFNANTAPFGAALYDSGANNYEVRSSTISGNIATNAAGGAVHIDTGSFKMMNTIVANTTGGGTNCHGSINNIGNNLDSGTSCGWGTGNHSLSNSNPQLDPLGNYGGLTQTMRLKPISPAIDSATFNSVDMHFETTDQRGYPRPADGNHDGTKVYDIGAYEVVPQIFLPLLIR